VATPLAGAKTRAPATGAAQTKMSFLLNPSLILVLLLLSLLLVGVFPPLAFLLALVGGLLLLVLVLTTGRW